MVRLFHPLSGIALLTIVYAADSAILASFGMFSAAMDLSHTLVFSFLVAWWARNDRRKLRYPAPYFEYDAFMFFAWFFLVPYYLFKTRRWRAVPIYASLIIAYEFPTLILPYILF